MENVVSVDQTAPWRNDPNAAAAHRALREWNILDRKDREVAVAKRSTLEAKQAAVLAYGLALIEGRKRYPADRDFHRWIERNELDAPPFADPKERSNAMRIAGLGSNLNLSNCPESWPSNMVKWARKEGYVQPKLRNGDATAAAREQVRVAVEKGEPINRETVVRETGAANGTVGIAVAMEKGRLEGIVEGEALALEPRFSKAQQHHVESAIKAKTKELAREHNARVRELERQFEAEVEKRFQARKAVAWPALEREKQEAREAKARYQALIDGRQHPFTLEEFRMIVMALHPDNSASEETRARALQSFNNKKLQLTGK